MQRLSLLFLTVAFLSGFGCHKDCIEAIPCITFATDDPTDNTVYLADIDQPPLFDMSCCGKEDPAGCSFGALTNEISSVIRYPAEARENGIQGRVEVRFIVEKDGTLTSFEVLQGIGGGCEEELIEKVLATSPWSPAIRAGHYVRSYQTVSVTFKLQ